MTRGPSATNRVGPRLARRHRTARDTTGGAEGNERLTAMTGAVLLVLLAIEGLTILRLNQLLTWHFFFGMLLVGPVLLKMGSTAYRFARYYAGSAPYVRKGPPAIALRVLGPVIVATSAVVIGSGIALAITGPNSSLWLSAHEVSFVLWFMAMTIHVLWYAPRLPGLLRSGSPTMSRARTTLAGAGKRWLLLVTALLAGIALAAATYHLAGSWTGTTSTRNHAGLGIGGRPTRL